jgi:hypothetical protein
MVEADGINLVERLGMSMFSGADFTVVGFYYFYNSLIPLWYFVCFLSNQHQT